MTCRSASGRWSRWRVPSRSPRTRSSWSSSTSRPRRSTSTPPASFSPIVRRAVAGGVSCILISHLLGEIIDNSDRIVVMRDGKVVAVDKASAFDRDKLVLTMGGSRGHKADVEAIVEIERHRGDTPLRVRARPAKQIDGSELVAHAGEIVGPGRARRPRPDGAAARRVQCRRAAQCAPRGQCAGGAGRRRPPDRRHLSAVVDRREHRHPLACRLAQGIPDIAGSSRTGLPNRGRRRSASARPTSRTTSCRCRAATSRRCCSPARSAPTR